MMTLKLSLNAWWAMEWNGGSPPPALPTASSCPCARDGVAGARDLEAAPPPSEVIRPATWPSARPTWADLPGLRD
ncbi:MAG: hypothetical protein J0H08_03530 [Rhizobiales bacterium]|nr:hypothetical protein [Hyphomicrobiales bacterium]